MSRTTLPRHTMAVQPRGVISPSWDYLSRCACVVCAWVWGVSMSINMWEIFFKQLLTLRQSQYLVSLCQNIQTAREIRTDSSRLRVYHQAKKNITNFHKRKIEKIILFKINFSAASFFWTLLWVSIVYLHYLCIFVDFCQYILIYAPLSQYSRLLHDF